MNRLVPLVLVLTSGCASQWKPLDPAALKSRPARTIGVVRSEPADLAVITLDTVMLRAMLGPLGWALTAMDGQTIVKDHRIPEPSDAIAARLWEVEAATFCTNRFARELLGVRLPGDPTPIPVPDARPQDVYAPCHLEGTPAWREADPVRKQQMLNECWDRRRTRPAPVSPPPGSTPAVRQLPMPAPPPPRDPMDMGPRMPPNRTPAPAPAPAPVEQTP